MVAGLSPAGRNGTVEHFGRRAHRSADVHVGYEGGRAAHVQRGTTAEPCQRRRRRQGGRRRRGCGCTKTGSRPGATAATVCWLIGAVPVARSSGSSSSGQRTITANGASAETESKASTTTTTNSYTTAGSVESTVAGPGRQQQSGSAGGANTRRSATLGQYERSRRALYNMATVWF